jgi:hypothetical protein
VDLDGDGQNEIISGSWPGEIYLFRKKPNGTYAAPETLKANGRPINVGPASAVTAADWDQDGDLDLVIGNIHGELHWMRNNGSAAKWAFANSEKLSANGQPIKVNLGDAGPCLTDWNSDGKLDLLVGTGAGEVLFFPDTGAKDKPVLEAAITLVDRGDANIESKSPKRPAIRTKVATADWNGDGMLDLLVGDYVPGQGSTREAHGWVWVYLRTASGKTVAATEK